MGWIGHVSHASELISVALEEEVSVGEASLPPPPQLRECQASAAGAQETQVCGTYPPWTACQHLPLLPPPPLRLQLKGNSYFGLLERWVGCCYAPYSLYWIDFFYFSDTKATSKMAKSSSKSRFIRDRLDSIRVVDPSPDHSKVAKTRFGHQSKIILKVSSSLKRCIYFHYWQ